MVLGWSPRSVASCLFDMAPVNFVKASMGRVGFFNQYVMLKVCVLKERPQCLQRNLCILRLSDDLVKEPSFLQGNPSGIGLWNLQLGFGQWGGSQFWGSFLRNRMTGQRQPAGQRHSFGHNPPFRLPVQVLDWTYTRGDRPAYPRETGRPPSTST